MELRGDDDEAPRRQDQRCHLIRTDRVVQQKKNLFVMEYMVIEGCQLGFLIGELRPREEGADDVGHHLGHRERNGEPPQVEKDLTVGIVGRNFGRKG